MKSQLKGKTVLITGISRGIGRELAYKFASKGAHIIGAARNKAQVDLLIKELTDKFEIKGLSIEGNVSRPNEVDDIVKKAINTFSRIDILINNAGVGSFNFVTNFENDSWNEMIAVNLTGTYLCVKAALPFMLKQKNGAIINISSICGIEAYAECAGYCASKYGIVGFSEALAKEVTSENVIIYVLCPDIVDTGFANNRNANLTDKEKMLSTGEIATVATDLLEQKSKSQICLIKIHLLTRIFRKFGIEKRKVKVKRIRYI
ncbi:MAG: SDR family oxidoreductase [Desulfobacterales bacterium]|nr:SDR family oxidoreductase [Desulfobacterales bacterium]